MSARDSEGACIATMRPERCTRWNVTSVARRAPARGHVLNVALRPRGWALAVGLVDRAGVDVRSLVAHPVARVAPLGQTGVVAAAVDCSAAIPAPVVVVAAAVIAGATSTTTTETTVARRAALVALAGALPQVSMAV